MQLPKSIAISLAAISLSLSSFSAANDWVHYGSDLASTKYAPFDQIDHTNVANLQQAWSWASPDNATVAANHAAENFRATPGAFKSTPIAIKGVLYISTSFGRVAAIDGISGQELWVFDTDSWQAGRPANLGYNHRGVSYWTNGTDERIVMLSNDAWMWSIDAKTGKLDTSFGDGGKVDLAQGLGREINRQAYTMIAAPLIYDNLVIVGSSIHDGPQFQEAPPGHVRAYDVTSGEQVWIFHTIAQPGEFGHETWESDSWQKVGNTNVWTQMSADMELGLVYLPVGTPTNDWYGGHRPGDNLYAESLVAVNARTGVPVWHFQAVKHGLWDYDMPAAPNLIDINVDGRQIKALAQISKQGFVYVLDRATGEPVWPIEDRPVPPSTVPGERASPTQPHPTRPAPFDLQGISDETLVNYTPEIRAEALANIERFDYGPLFTPPSLRGTINLPGWAGGGGWQGSAVDPETGMIYIPSATSEIVVQLVEPEAGSSDFSYVRGGLTSVNGPQGLPLTKPPYGRLTAIDLNTGDHKWVVPHGEGIRQRIIDLGILDPGPVGSTSRTGPVLTKTLLFIAQQDGRRSVMRAFDKETGAVVHEIDLPSVPSATPMTYMAGGKQYIAIALGGATESSVVSYALP
ncbi:MAG: pyrroloquinoline quinone-dependent dehydrogenase [Pseudohongiella sp.]|nr:pyrroloquinoline quinone-dependent dehydrogenase [Pseudohongiella sp.]